MRLFLVMILTFSSMQLWADKKAALEDGPKEQQTLSDSAIEKKLSGKNLSGKFESSIDIKETATPAAKAKAKAIQDNDRLEAYYKMKAEIPRLEAEIERKKGQIKEADTGWNRFWSPGKTKQVVDRLNQEIADARKYIASLQRRIKMTEEDLIIQVWRNGVNGLELIEKKLGSAASVLSCTVIQDESGNFNFFETSAAYQAWLKAEGEENQKIAYNASKDPYIKACLDSQPEGASKKVTGPMTSLCKLPDTYHSTYKKYDLKKVNGQIVISTSISFNYKGKAEKRAEAFKRVQEAIPCMQEFFARQGIKLELTIRNESGASSCYHNINLHDDFDRSNSNNWATHNDLGRETTAGTRCSVYIHELSHVLGLPDAYPDPDCPDRKPLSAENDIMRTTCVDSSNLTFFPESIKKLLGPLCGN